MSTDPLDLEAARADIATVAATDGRVYGIDQLDEVYAAQAAQVRIVDRHAPALLAELDRAAGWHRRLQEFVGVLVDEDPTGRLAERLRAAGFDVVDIAEEAGRG